MKSLLKNFWKFYLSPILRGVSPNSSEGVDLRVERLNWKGQSKGIIGAEIDEDIADAIKQIFEEDKRQKAFLAGIDEDKFDYKGLTPKEISSKLRERGYDW